MRRYIFFILLLYSTLLTAQEIRTIQGEFVQIREQAMFAKPQESRGIFYFVADTMLRWEYTSPSRFGIIANGKNIKLLRDGKTTQSDNTHALQSMIGMIMQTIKGIDSTTNTDFAIQTSKQGDETLLILSPNKRANRAAFTRMEIILEPNSKLAKQVRMHEKSGDTTTIIFSHLQLNQPISPSLF